MDFPLIHTNFWDAVIAVPAVMIITQLLKVFLKVPKMYIGVCQGSCRIFFIF